MVEAQTIARGASAFLCFCIYMLLCCGMIESWRTLHNEVDMENKLIRTRTRIGWNGVTIPNNTGLFSRRLSPENLPMRFNITKNDAIIFSCKECGLVEHVGFVGDTLMLAMFCTALIFYILNFLFLLFCRAKSCCIVPYFCILASICMLIGIIVFCCYYNELYISHENENPMPEAKREELKSEFDISVHDYYISFPFFLVTTFSVGFYLTVAAFLANILAFVVAIFAAIETKNLLLSST
uniref:Uncharacterized protein n=1 Tax=Panagrolaimus sp. ES5 TaxID=591445 RepID=A0AC34G503_9BILA